MRLRKDGIDSMARVNAARARSLRRPRDLDEKPNGGTLGTETTPLSGIVEGDDIFGGPSHVGHD